MGGIVEVIVQSLLDNYLKTPGKMIRPQLISLLGNVFDIKQTEMDLLAQSAEMIHNASLIHDDVIDEAEMRRGEKSLNKIVSNSQAVLAGDFLLAKVIADLVAAKQYEILRTLAETLEDIVEGEFMQDRLKTQELVTEKDLNEVARKKTGALLGWCCSSIAQLAHQEKDVVMKCHEMGIKLGVAFQLIDDTLDYSTASGKDFAKDLKEGLINFTTLKLITRFKKLDGPVNQLRRTEFSEVPWSEDELKLAIDETKAEADKALSEVEVLLKSITDRDTSSFLVFLEFLRARIK